MSLLDPHPFPFDFDEWKTQPFHVRAKWLCQAWAIQGFGAPRSVYLFYVVKTLLYIGGWLWFASFSEALGSPETLARWWSHPEAIVKAIAWSMLFEGLGLASGSGPLTGRYMPPFGGALYYLRPGTIRIPLLPQLPILGGDRRTATDCLLYLLHIALLVRSLLAPSVTPELLWPTVILLPLMSLRDRAMVMTSRPEHYLIGLICFLSPGESLAAAKWVWLGVWFWAATSKLNRHFPSVISVMLANSGLLPSRLFRDRLFRSHPDDLRTTVFTSRLAHFGTVTEYFFPLLLMSGFLFDGTASPMGVPVTVLVGLVIMLGFHTFITLSVPMGVPIEWNVMMVYGGFALFGGHPDASPLSLQSGPLVASLLIALFVIPLLGNLFPAWISFLLGMRFYAGNWAYSVWLFRDDAEEKIASEVTTISKIPEQQLGRLYEASAVQMVLSRVISFRMMHLHGRVLHDILPQAVDDIDRYTWRDGELVCGVVVGWNFGDGHLHNEHLLRALQRRCQWESGEVRVIFVNPQPMGRPFLSWRICDARDGQLACGRTAVDDLVDRQPWPADPVNESC